MTETVTSLSCTCGAVRVEVRGTPIITTECHCNSCREAGRRLGALPGAPEFVAANGGTPFALYRKDRAEIAQGREQLREFRLKPDSPTRRVVATCCNTPVFLEFQHGHWLSIYEAVWPTKTMPAIELRTMTSDLSDRSVLDDTVPAGKRQTWGFYGRLFAAWAAMGFRTPKLEVSGKIEA